MLTDVKSYVFTFFAYPHGYQFIGCLFLMTASTQSKSGQELLMRSKWR